MADRIKGITIEIGGDTTGLNKALSGTNKEIRNTQSQLKDVERLLKLDPSNTELLKQKQKLLAEAVEETGDKLEKLKTAEKQAQNQFKEGKISEEQYNALKREIIATEQELEKTERQSGSVKCCPPEDQPCRGENAGVWWKGDGRGTGIIQSIGRPGCCWSRERGRLGDGG